jgi:hypothetical protein
MTIPELEEKIMAAVAELRDANDALELLSKEYAVTDHKYRHAKAMAYLAASGTVNERTAHVDKVCGPEREAAHTAEALMNAAKERVRSLQSELSAYQTIARLAMGEMAMAGRYE